VIDCSSVSYAAIPACAAAAKHAVASRRYLDEFLDEIWLEYLSEVSPHRPFL